ncbi:hypothetical protein HDU86_002618 [Geranomyces michiganensis]|nr:hypothetical protein HDU86_002618 [Geranomyces michiganensis]
MHTPSSSRAASRRLRTIHPATFLILLLLALFPTVSAISSSTNATWDPATLDYCAANPGPRSINGTAAESTPCYTDQVLTRQNTSTQYVVGGTAIMYLKFVTTGPLGGKNYTSTALFYPVVDDYSELQIPNSWPQLRVNTTALHSPQVSLELLYAGSIYALPYKRWATLVDASVLYVPSRTAIITLDNGMLRIEKGQAVGSIGLTFSAHRRADEL